MNVKACLTLASVASLTLISSISRAQVVYSENFDVNNAAGWNINLGTGNNAGNVFFDYSTVGIPSAPNSTGGTTRGLQLRANFATVGALTGVSASPLGLSLSGDYTVKYDFWQNFNGPAAATSSGTTQLTGAGIGTSGTTAQHAGISSMSSVWFAQTGDGGNGLTTYDYRAYSSAAGGGGTSTTLGGIGYTSSSGIWAAGTGTTSIDNANAYYASLGLNTVPSSQTALATAQSGTTAAGAPGFRWHSGEIDKVGNIITYYIDGKLIATVNASSLTLGGGDIEFIQSDVNTGVSTDPNALTYEFGLFDNIIVSIPEPSTCALGLLGLGSLLAFRRRK